MSTKVEADDGKSCPPGMIPDPENEGKCIPASEAKTEETNAGDTASVGAGTNVDADDSGNSNPKQCPPGMVKDSEGNCVPSQPVDGTVGNPSGDAGIGGEALKEIFKNQQEFMSQLAYWQNNSWQEGLKSLSEKMGVKSESASFGGASSKVDDTTATAVYESTVAQPAAFFESCRPGKQPISSEIAWQINVEAYLNTLNKHWFNYNGQVNSPIVGSGGYKLNKDGSTTKAEAITITGGDMPQIFSKQLYLIPGGRMRVPIRQFLDTQIITDSDRFNWYKINGFDFDATTAEGTEATNEAQAVTKVTGTPNLVRANQTINYSDIENAPFDLIEGFNRAAALGALKAEDVEVLDTTYNAITPTNWVNANTGAEIASDDVAGMTAKQEGLYAASRLIQDQGGDISQGNLVLFANPKYVQELIVDVAPDFYTGQNPLNGTALGVLENRLGMDIIPINTVHAQNNVTNDTFRNVLAVKGSLGLTVAADLQIEAQRRPDLSAVKVGARHRLKGTVIDETMTCRISSAQ